MITLGFESYTEQGPGIFLHRLRMELAARGRFSESEPDVWVQLSFQKLPQPIEERRREGKTLVLVRMNGCYCTRQHVIRKPFVLPLPLLDNWRSKKVNGRKNAQLRHNLEHADGIVFQSEFSRKLTWHFVTATPPGTIIYNGVPLSDFSADGPTLPELSGRVNILVSHGFQPYHRLHDAMRILAKARTLMAQPVHLNIVGGDNGQSFPHARQIAESLGLREGTDYTFWGKRPFNELAALYRSCQLMLNLSYWDSCPNVVIEALACGLPVVGVNHGGVGELVQNAGILVDEAIPFTYLDHLDFARMPKAPVTAYAEALATVAENPAPYREGALERVRQHFDIRRVCDQYLAAAESLTGKRPVAAGDAG